MLEHTADKEALVLRIKAKRKQIADYLNKTAPRHSWLITCSIVAGTLAATLTAGPGVGGEGFISTAKNVVKFGIPVWQVLCLAATGLSIAAVITNGMLKSYDYASKIANASRCDAKLEGIEIMLEFDQLNVGEATKQYTQCLTEVSDI